MLELRPNCELCDKDLSPSSTDARICTYECTFCSDCVEHALKNVCPNCGGGFSARPIRPQQDHRPGVSLSHQGASSERVLTKYTVDEISAFAQAIESIPPEKR